MDSKASRKNCRVRLARWLWRSLLAIVSCWLVLSFWQAPVVKLEKITQLQLRGIWITNIGSALMYYTTRLDEVVRKEHGGNSPPNNPADPEWMAWRSEKLTQLMTKIASSVKAVRKSAIVSLSPNQPEFAYRQYLQNWPQWVDLGLLDEVVVQVYRQDLASLKAELSKSRFLANRQIPISIGLYTGPFLSAKPIQQVQAEVQAVQAAGYQGVSFFCWETTLWLFQGSPASQVKQTFLKLFPNAAQVRGWGQPQEISLIFPNLPHE